MYVCIYIYIYTHTYTYGPQDRMIKFAMEGALARGSRVMHDHAILLPYIMYRIACSIIYTSLISYIG